MFNRILILSALIPSLWVSSAWAVDEIPGPQSSDSLVIKSVIVQDKNLRPNPGKELSLGASPKIITFNIEPLPEGRTPLRLRWKLEGYDTGWHEGVCEMYSGIRFMDDAGDQVDIKSFKVMGDSTGWKGTLEDSALTHRRETVVVPPRATHLQMIISSAGPPATVGIYVVDDLVVSKVGGSHQASEILMQAPFNGPSDDNLDPPGWVRDGIRPRMAQIMELGQDPKTKAFAILDDDPFGHAEWHNAKESLPRVWPGDNLILE